MTSSAGVTGPMRWAVLNRPFDGEPVSGDRHLVIATDDGALVAVVDGLGHGREAALAATEAIQELERDSSRSVTSAIEACHRALARTRGAAVSVVRIAGGELAWLGVGNVEAVVVRGLHAPVRRVRLTLAGGVVGHGLPSLRATTTSIARGDLLVLATDGLRPDVMEHVDALATPEAVVDRLMRSCRTGRDDALAFAARYDGAT